MNKCRRCSKEIETDDAYCPECDTFLTETEKLKKDELSTLPDTTPDDKKSLIKLGSVVNERFEIIDLVGQGGMGDVYKAKDIILDEIVALKVLKPKYSDDKTMVERFKREIKMARKVRQRNVCGIYDYGSSDDKLYISMEFIEGETLSHYIRQDRLTIESITQILKDIVLALGVAHEEKIIHRDLKPQNIMIKPDMEAVITDFGIAKQRGVSKLTRNSEIIGTPFYMAPESFSEKKIDYRSDIYALGIILYEILTGMVPFPGESPFIVAMKHLHNNLEFPEDLKKETPDTLKNIVLKCTAKNPEDRYQSVYDILEEFEESDEIRILIADDDKDIVKLLSKVVTSKGYEVITADDGEQALEKALKEKPSLICLDYNMPKMDGYQVAEFLMNNSGTRNIPIIMITAMGDDEGYKAYSKSIGIKEFITKPFELIEVAEKIQQLLVKK